MDDYKYIPNESMSREFEEEVEAFLSEEADFDGEVRKGENGGERRERVGEEEGREGRDVHELLAKEEESEREWRMEERKRRRRREKSKGEVTLSSFVEEKGMEVKCFAETKMENGVEVVEIQYLEDGEEKSERVGGKEEENVVIREESILQTSPLNRCEKEERVKGKRE